MEVRHLAQFLVVAAKRGNPAIAMMAAQCNQSVWHQFVNFTSATLDTCNYLVLVGIYIVHF